MKTHLFPALKMSLLCMLFFVGVYALMVFSIAQFAPAQGKGETLMRNGQVVGFARIGQKFTEDRYFNSRPSAVEYNAAGSGGSNKGPSNPDYLVQIQARIDTFLVHNPAIAKKDIPSEMVTASGSGLDPDLSPAAARIQVARIAKIRHIPEQQLQALITEKTQAPLFGLFGTYTINVLDLNISLDKLAR